MSLATTLVTILCSSSFGLSQAWVIPSFAVNNAAASSALAKVASRIPSTTFKLNLNIGKKDQESRIGIRGLTVRPKENRATFSMPGANGPRPNFSSGAKHLEVNESPSFIGLHGLQQVVFEGGAWELVWRDNAPAGSLIMGFNCPDGAVRNDASLPAGRLFAQFSVWKLPELLVAQEELAQAKIDAQKLLDDKDKAFEEMNKTNNLLMKALKYREACVAMEKINFRSDMRRMADKVPEMEDTVDIDGLLVCTKGTVWCKTIDMFGPHHILLGDCRLEAHIGRRALGAREEGLIAESS